MAALLVAEIKHIWPTVARNKRSYTKLKKKVTKLVEKETSYNEALHLHHATAAKLLKDRELKRRTDDVTAGANLQADPWVLQNNMRRLHSDAFNGWVSATRMMAEAG